MSGNDELAAITDMDVQDMRPRLIYLGFGGLVLFGLGVPVSAGAQGNEVILTEAVRDVDGDGIADTLAIVMLDGRRFEDEEQWCGSGKKYQGDFEIRVRVAGHPPTAHALTSYSFFRAVDWTISFDDYNRDGQLDFNLGQYASCNGWRYELFTVDSIGRVRQLQTSRSALPVSDVSNSTDDIVLIPGGFEHCYYHSGLGHLVERYRWSEERGVFFSEGERPVERCRPS